MEFMESADLLLPTNDEFITVLMVRNTCCHRIPAGSDAPSGRNIY